MALQTKTLVKNGANKHHKFTLTVVEESTNIADNNSTISWSFVLSSLGGTYDWSYTNTVPVTYTVTINGTKYTGNIMRYDGDSTVTIRSGSETIAHNADGSKSISYSFSVSDIGKSFLPGFASANDTMDLTDIPRKATLTAAPDFTDEENPTITYSNPAGSAVTSLQVCIADARGNNAYVPYREVGKTSTSYTFNLTDAERKTLRKAVTEGGSVTVKFFVRTTIGGTNYYSSIAKTLTLVNYMPTLAPTVQDIGGVSTTLTGNPNTMIRYFNVMQAVINASAKKEATISKNYIKCGEDYLEANEHNFVNVDSNYFKFTTIDNRGNTVSKEITMPMIEYVPLTCNIDADIGLDTSDGTKASINFTVSGNYFNGSFGAVNNSLTVSYTLTNGTTGAVLLTKNLSVPTEALVNGTYKVSDAISDLDYKTSYIITVKASDKIAKDVTATSKALKATPVFDWGENDFNFNVPVSIDNIEIDYPVEQGVKNGWTYRKWNSGLAECWYTASVSGINVGEYNLDGFYYCGSKGVNFPFTFTSVSYVNATGGSTGNMNFVRPFNYSNSNMTYIVMGLAKLSSVTATVNLEVKGRWK